MAADPIIAELHRVERIASSLREGESAVINGTAVAAVSLAEAERLLAAQAKADAVIRLVGETPESDRLLRVAITDVKTEQRLATCFVNYGTAGPTLRLVPEEAS